LGEEKKALEYLNYIRVNTGLNSPLKGKILLFFKEKAWGKIPLA